MTDGQWLLLLFSALYAAECLRWVPGRAWVLGGPGGGWSLRRPLQHVALWGRHWVLLPVLPPLRTHLLLETWPCTPVEAGLELAAPEGTTSPVCVPWADLKPQAEGASLHLAPGVKVPMLSEASALAWKTRLKEWAALPPEQRAAAFLKHARQTLDVRKVEQEADRTARATRRLRLLGTLIFITCFGVLAAVYRWLGEGLAVLGIAGGLLGLMWTQAVLFWRACGRQPTKVKFRAWKALAIALLPQNAMRAGDLLCGAGMVEFHPLAARALLPEQAWLRLLRQTWKAAVHGLHPGDALRRQALEAFLKQEKIAEAMLEEVPERQPDSAAYCPRCLAQFRQVDAVCKDCGGLPLKPFPPS